MWDLNVFFFVANDKNLNLIKPGSTKDIVQRLRNYNVWRVKEVDLKYLSIVKNSELIEKCIKLKLKDKQFYENREIYEVDPKKLKKIILDCYCKYVTNKENSTMYEELSQLAGLYAYVKDKKKYKPYVIINKK